MAPDTNDGNPFFSDNVSSILAGVGSAVFVLMIYRCLSMFLCNRHHMITNQNTTEQARSPADTEASTLNSVPHMIPSHKYEKKKKKKNDDDVEDDAGGDEDGTCAVCLGDFEEGDELRTMPECMHSFHVPCIDMWLCSHSSCPICRADATPSSTCHQLNEHHNIDINMTQIAIVQSGLRL